MGGTKLWASCGLIATAVCALTGCPNPNTYGTPRTTPQGKISHTVALEGFSMGGDIPSSVTTDGKVRYNLVLPNFPTYQMRIGLGDTVDLGWRLANMMTPMIDVKWNFFRSEGIDLAIDPGVQWLYYAFQYHLPLIIGLNVNDTVSFVPSVGAVFVQGLGSGQDTDLEKIVGASSTVLLRAGLGINIRMSDVFAFQPEATLEQSFNEVHSTFITFGLGLNFGKLPKFGTSAEPKPKKPPPPPLPQNEDVPPDVAPPPPSTTDNGPPAVVAVAPSPPAGANGCRSVCSANDGVVSATEANALNQKLDPVMRDVKRCLDAAVASVSPGILLTFDGGFLRAAKIDTGGNDSDCIANASRKIPQLQSSHSTIKCDYQCGN